jgi:PAS domain S-box-containing protein
MDSNRPPKKAQVKKLSGHEVWHGLNEAAVTLHRSSHSAEAVLQAFARHIRALGLEGCVGLLDEAGEQFEVLVAAWDETVSEESVPERWGAGEYIPVDSDPACRQAVKTGQPGLQELSSGSLEIVLPLTCASLQKGLVILRGPGIQPDALPVVASFADHLAAAIDNAQAFVALQQEEILYSGLVDASSEGYLIVDLETNCILLANARMAAIAGVDLDELVGRSLSAMHPRESKGGLGAWLEQILRKDQAEFDLRVPRRGRNERMYHVSTSVLLSGGKRLLQIIMQDITERVIVESALRESEATFRALTETATTAIFIYQGDIFRYVNPAMEAISGYPASELLGMHFWEIVHPDYREHIRQQNLRRQRNESVPSRFQIKILTKLGDERWVDYTTRTVLYEGQPATLGTAFDITDRRVIEQALQRRAEEFAALHALSLDITTLEDYPELMQKIVELAVQLLHAKGGGLYVADPVRQEVRSIAGFNIPHEFMGLTLSYGEGAAGWVAENRQPLIVDDYRVWPGRAKVFEEKQPFTAVLAVPMMYQNQMVGVLDVIDDVSRRRFTQSDLELFSLFSSQAAIALENARLFGQVAVERRHLSLLYDVSRELVASLDSNEILSRALTLTTTELEGWMGQAYLYLHGENRLSLRALYGQDEVDVVMLDQQLGLRPGDGLAGWVAQQRRPACVADVSQDERWLQVPGLDDGARAAISAPIIYGDALYGVLTVLHTRLNAFSADDVSLLEAICQEVGLALSNASRYQQIERQLAEITLIQSLAQTFNQRLELQVLLDEVVLQLHKRLGYPQVRIFLIEDQSLVLKSFHGPRLPHDCYSLSEGIIGRVARTGQVAFVPDVNLDPDYKACVGTTVAEIAVPIFSGSIIVGVINIETDQPGRLTEQDRDLLQVLAGQVSIALENAVLYEKVRRHAEDLEHMVDQRTAELKELFELSQEIGSALSFDEMLRLLLTHLHNAVRCDVVAGGLFLEGFRSQYLETTRPLSPTALQAIQDLNGAILPLDGTGQSAEPLPLEVILAGDNQEGAAHIDRLASTIHAPIYDGKNMVGVLIAGQREPGFFRPEHERLLTTFANQAASAVLRLETLLAAEQKRLESLVEHMPVGVLLLDGDHRVLLANPLGKSILETLGAEFSNGTLIRLGALSFQDLIAIHDSPLAVELTTQQTPLRYFEAQVRPVGSPKGQWVLMLRDVTQERDIQARIQMQERLATVGQLAAGIAHDFNNIMAAILVYADLLQHDPSLPPVSRDRLAIIQEQVQRAASLIRQILDFSRRSVMDQSPLDLLPFMKELEKILVRVMPETIRVKLNYRTGAYRVNADPTRLQQVFMNLATNARDAMPEGGTLLYELDRLTLRPGDEPPVPEMPTGEWVSIAVSDTGHGIPPEVMQHLFEPFYTTKPVGQGTGLGLAQVYGIIKQHGGYIGVASQAGVGTTITICLKALPEDAGGDTPGEPVELATGVGETILLVEDDRVTREAIQTMLEAYNYHVLTAANGVEALKRIDHERAQIVLVISDLVMPQMGGVALYHALQKRWPQVKVLFVTGHPLEGENQVLLESGEISWLQKPFSVREFNQAVRDLLKS